MQRHINMLGVTLLLFFGLVVSAVAYSGVLDLSGGDRVEINCVEGRKLAMSRQDATTIVAKCNPQKISGQSVTGLMLVNAETNTDIAPVSNGDTINLASLPTLNLNIRADTNPARVGSVKFDVNGSSHLENTAPYTLFGNTRGVTPSSGAYTLTAVPFTKKNGAGKAGTGLTIAFEIINQSDNPAPRPIPADPAPPNPTTPQPANPNATQTARQILGYLQQLPTQSDNRVIAGQLGAFDSEVADGLLNLQKIHDQTGQWVALTGMDYRNWDKDHRNNLAEPNRFLIEQWQQGSLVTLSWHANNPWTGGDASDMTGESRLDELLTPGTAAHDQWLLQLDDIASGLQELEDAGVVVIWRPFHEMNGGWFWWYSDQDGEPFKRLWRHMFNYFTHEKGLDNLLWAYSPNHAYDQWKQLPPYYYPGDEYVDLVGLDYYRPLNEDPIVLNGYDELVAMNKPVALFEFGPSPADAWEDRPNYDYSKLIRDIREQYPQIVLFLAWEWHWAIGENDNAAGLMNDPWIVTRDELPPRSSP